MRAPSTRTLLACAYARVLSSWQPAGGKQANKKKKKRDQANEERTMQPRHDKPVIVKPRFDEAAGSGDLHTVHQPTLLRYSSHQLFYRLAPLFSPRKTRQQHRSCSRRRGNNLQRPGVHFQGSERVSAHAHMDSFPQARHNPVSWCPAGRSAFLIDNLSTPCSIQETKTMQADPPKIQPPASRRRDTR